MSFVWFVVERLYVSLLITRRKRGEKKRFEKLFDRGCGNELSTFLINNIGKPRESRVKVEQVLIFRRNVSQPGNGAAAFMSHKTLYRNASTKFSEWASKERRINDA